MASLPDSLRIDSVTTDIDEATDTKNVTVGVRNMSQETVTAPVTVMHGDHGMEHEVIVGPDQVATFVHPVRPSVSHLTVGGTRVSV